MTKTPLTLVQGFRQELNVDEDVAGPLLLIDTAGCDMVEAIDDDFDDSKLNEGEARVALKHCQRLLDLGIKMTDIGIITPYGAQVEACTALHLDPAACKSPPCCLGCFDTSAMSSARPRREHNYCDKLLGPVSS